MMEKKKRPILNFMAMKVSMMEDHDEGELRRKLRFISLN
jgi:hypothetical protein